MVVIPKLAQLVRPIGAIWVKLDPILVPIGANLGPLQPSEILNFSFLGNIIGKYIEKYIEICSIHVKISWEIKKTKARPSAAPPRGVVFFISHDMFT